MLTRTRGGTIPLVETHVPQDGFEQSLVTPVGKRLLLSVATLVIILER